MDQVIHILLFVPRFSLGARLLCMQKAREFEEAVAFIVSGKCHFVLESDFHYAEKLRALMVITSYLLEPASSVCESQFLKSIVELDHGA